MKSWICRPVCLRAKWTKFCMSIFHPRADTLISLLHTLFFVQQVNYSLVPKNELHSLWHHNSVIFNNNNNNNIEKISCAEYSEHAQHSERGIVAMLTSLVEVKTFLTLITSNFYSSLFYNSEIWHIPTLKATLKQKLHSASAMALRVSICHSWIFIKCVTEQFPRAF